MKIALIMPPIDDEYSMYGKEFDWGWWQPLGLLSIASYLKEKNPEIIVRIFDEQTEGGVDAIESKIKDFMPEWIGIAPSIFTYNNSLYFAKSGKEIGARIIFGGHYATSMGETILANRDFVDYVIVEDGESAMFDLLHGKSLTQIPNLIWRDRGMIIKNAKEWINLDNLPIIDYSLVDLKQYFNQHNQMLSRTDESHGFLAPLTVSGQRGCGWREKSKGGCLYCSCINPFWRGHDTFRLWENIKIYQRKYGIDSLVFTEDDFLSRNSWFDNFYKSKPKDDCPKIRFVFTRPDSLTEDNILKLKDLGCYQIYLGIESGSNKSLAAMKKGIKAELILDKAKLLHKHGLKFVASFVLGAPNESEDDLEKTLLLSDKLVSFGAIHFTAYPLVPVPGSQAWNLANKKSDEFKKIFLNKDSLDLTCMIGMWNEIFCKVDIMKISKACDEINAKSFTNRKSTEQWLIGKEL